MSHRRQRNNTGLSTRKPYVDNLKPEVDAMNLRMRLGLFLYKAGKKIPGKVGDYIINTGADMYDTGELYLYK